jgi:hypothetical protein
MISFCHVHPKLAFTTVPLLLTFLSLFSGNIYSQDSNAGTSDYRQIFAQDYTFALNIIDQNPWWSDTLKNHGIDPDFTLAIIFPELIRYSSILDYIEIKSLEVLYVQYGEDYADFSVGYFQMKPSFAEHIEADILKYSLENQYPELNILKSSVADDPEHRSERVSKLKDEYYQVIYLEAFIRIMDFVCSDWIPRLTPAMKLQFYATAYNTGYFKDISIIREEMKKDRFFTGMFIGDEKYSYSDISLDYYVTTKR